MNYFKEKLGISLSIVGIAILLLVSYFGLTHLNTWHDEIFSMWIVNLPFNQFWTAVIEDVHPPLYYLIYKFFVSLFNLFDVHNLTFIGKIVSLIPIYLLTAFSILRIRKSFGMQTAGLFIFFITAMPLFIKYALEVRMYSWTIFFVTLSFVYIYEVSKNPSNKNWIILTVLTICSAYTQYFSLLSSVILYLIFLAYIVRKNRILLRKWFLSAIICVIAYIPWIPIAYSQFKTGQGGYWIPPITLDTVISYVYEVFLPIGEFKIIGILFFISIIVLIVICLFKYKDELNYYAFSGILAFILVPIIGITISFIFFPIFHKRYLLPLLGTFWLSIAILISGLRSKNQKVFAVFIIIVLVAGGFNVVNSLNNEQIDYEDTIAKNETLHKLVGSNNIIIFDNQELYLDFGTYFLKNNDHYKFDNKIGQNINELLKEPSIQSKIADGSKVYYIDSISKGDTSNYQECVDSQIRLSEIYSSNPGDHIRDFKIYEIL